MARTFQFGPSFRLRRWGAVLACLALLYFAAGGHFLHQHQSGRDTVCHVCHSLDAPALTSSASGIVSAPEVSTGLTLRILTAVTLDDFALLPSGRAPPP